MKIHWVVLGAALSCSGILAQEAAQVKGAAAPLALAPERTVIVTPDQPADAVAEAAATLQEFMRKAGGATQGFEVVAESKAGDIAGKTVLALDRTKWAQEKDAADLWQDSFVIRRRGNVIVITGGKPRGTFNGAVAFLDHFCGVRFYLPGDLFTSLPKEKELVVPGAVDIREEPFVKATSMSGGGAAPGLGPWLKRNNANSRTGLAGTHQHNMWGAFPPDKYAAKYPEIYPIVKGQRYIPKDARDQGWNPCWSEPKLLDAAEETVTEYYQKNPDALWYSFGCQDSHVVCECPRCKAVYDEFLKKDPKLGRDRAVSEMYWKFMNQLAERLEKKLPGKRIEGLAYATTRFVPPFKLHPNIVVFTNFHIAELEGDGVLKPNAQGVSPLDEWLNVASAYGNHDWYEGMGYLIPRIYSGYWAQYMRRVKSRAAVTYQHAEMYAHWGLDGPKGYVLARLWWNPDNDPQALLRQFCADMFGPAAAPMDDYFTQLEALWVLLDDVEGPERKLKSWARQFITTEKDRGILRQCRADLDQAAGLAQTPDEKARIELFSKTFRVSEYLFELSAAQKVSSAKLNEIREYVREKIMKDPMTFKESGSEEIVKVVDAAMKAVAGKKVVAKDPAVGEKP